MVKCFLNMLSSCVHFRCQDNVSVSIKSRFKRRGISHFLESLLRYFSSLIQNDYGSREQPEVQFSLSPDHELITALSRDKKRYVNGLIYLNILRNGQLRDNLSRENDLDDWWEWTVTHCTQTAACYLCVCVQQYELFMNHVMFYLAIWHERIHIMADKMWGSGVRMVLLWGALFPWVFHRASRLGSGWLERSF